MFFERRTVDNKLVTCPQYSAKTGLKRLPLAKIRYMINDVIAKFIEGGHLSQNPLKIEFKKRNAIHGIFVKSPDYEDLKSKNFWRIVGESNISEWQKSHDNNLAKIFNGSEFNRIILPKKAAASAE